MGRGRLSAPRWVINPPPVILTLRTPLNILLITQPQGHAQIIANLVDFGMNVQEAGDAARYDHDGSTQPTGQVMTNGGTVQLEGGVCDAIIADLQSRGHNIVRGSNSGGYQAIQRTPIADAGGGWVYAGATEMRKDGLVAAY